jgi:dihydropteroate synthase
MRLGQRTLDPAQPLLVGILNLTPDSFSDGGELPDLDAVLKRAEQLVRDGADVLDVGGESTRPGAAPVSADSERARVIPAIAAVVQRFPVPLSVDTRRAEVALEALAAGAVMVNDVSGFGDPAMGEVVASAGAAWVIMHMPASPAAIEWNRPAGDIPDDVGAALERIAGDLTTSVQRATAAGVSRDQIAIDPGIGFGKSVAQNLALLAPSTPIARIGLPLYFGPSRKSCLAAAIAAAGRAVPVPRERLHATAAAVTAAVLAGAAFVRVHDVREMRDVLDVAVAIRDAGAWWPIGP